MRFGNPVFIFISLFWIIPVLILFYIYAFRKKERLIELFCEKKLFSELMPYVSKARSRLKAFFILVALFFIIFSLLQPQWGFHWEDIKRKGVDIMVAVDVSESMLAEDVEPNRLERAKRELQDLLKMLEGDRIGLVAYAGTSFVQCPLTLDYGAARMFLDYINPDLIPLKGTAISQAVKTCIEAFDRSKRGSQVIILITDGEDHQGEPLKAAEEAKNKGIKIFTIGIGKEGGAPIPLQDGSGGFKKDSRGNMIMTKLDEVTLQKMALETGGIYVRSVTGDIDLEKIYKEEIKKKIKQQELKSTRKEIWEERFQWFLFLAIIFLLWEQVVGERRKARGREVEKMSKN
ncbi:MAG: VWA domain-containing protein [bacterium]